ncbi:MAG: DHHW family protein [Mogibacterium sp.]|nr:DHHW family protein [Mogibacterium sp.]
MINYVPKTASSLDPLKYTDYSDAIEQIYPKYIAGRYGWINANGLYQKLIGRSFVDDNEADVYRMDNGQLIYGIGKMSDEEMIWYSDNVACLSDDLAEVGIPLLYVQLPYKIKNGDNILPVGCTEYGNANANSLITTMSNADVEVFDLRSKVNELSRDYYSLFYNTDQHWTNETALWAADTVAHEASDRLDLSYNPNAFDIDHYKVTEYSNHFLGSFGKKTGSWYAGTDDYHLVVPTFDTDLNFSAETETGKIERSGTFDTALLDKSNLKIDLFHRNTYETYTGGNYKFTKITNKKNPDGSRVLLIRDSFSSSMMPFLSLAYSELDSVDLRYFEGSALELAKKGNYDAVIIVYNPTVFGEPAFTFDN